MFQRYKIKLTEDILDTDIESQAKAYDVIFSEKRKSFQDDLQKYVGKNGVINAEALVADWFPQIQANIFLSHSHQDETLVKAFAYQMYQKHGILSFIDSCVWGYANNLLYTIDDAYCRSKTGNGDFDYFQRNLSTSHVHMMLNCALMEMMNQAECLIFVDMPNSINTKEIINQGQTESPLIYSELICSKLLQIRSCEEHRGLMMHFDESAKLPILYPADTKHLKEIRSQTVIRWLQQGYGHNPYKALNGLYIMMSEN